MSNNSPTCCVILTYKNKILLASPDLKLDGSPQHPWCFIESKKSETEPFEASIIRKIKQATQLELKNIRRLKLESENNENMYFYHGELTDYDVNHIERREGERLEFYTLPEVSKLHLSDSTQGFLAEYKNVVQELFPQ